MRRLPAESGVESFAFIGHYPQTEGRYKLMGPVGPLLRRFPRSAEDLLMRAFPPYQIVKFPNLTSSVGNTIGGFGLIAPFCPKHITTWGENLVLEKVINAGRLAERLGAKLIGLAGFTSVVGDEGSEVAKELTAAVTSGNTLTAALTLQGIRKAAQWMDIPLKNATVAIIGATGDIGSICTKVLSREAQRLQIAARNMSRIKEFASTLTKNGGCEVRTMQYVSDAIHGADVILLATSSVTTMVESADVKSGAILCDVAVPHNVGAHLVRQRNDVFVFEGGFAKLSGQCLPREGAWTEISPDGFTIFGCLAETLALSFERRFESYSIGRGNIVDHSVREIQHIAERHGLQLADFRYNDTVYEEASVKRILRCRKRRQAFVPMTS